MAYEEDDLFDDDFDFVDDDSDVEAERDDDVADEPAPPKEKSKRPAPKKRRGKAAEKKEPVAASSDDDDDDASAPVDEDGEVVGEDAPQEEKADEPPQPVGPPADHVVHIYEFGKFQRTIVRPFTDEDAVAFSEEYSRTGKSYGRLAIPAHQDETPAQSFADAAKN